MHGIAIVAALAVPPLLAAQTVKREAVLEKYCVTCHSARAKSGGLVLEGLPTDDPAGRPDVWEKVVRRVSAGEMPPPLSLTAITIPRSWRSSTVSFPPRGMASRALKSRLTRTVCI